MHLKTKLGFIYRGLKGIFHSFIDDPEISIQTTGTIEKTHNGNDIEFYKFGDGDEKILYFGGIHGNEIGSVKLMNHWVNYLSDNIPKDTTVYVTPCLNIDGYNIALRNKDYLRGGKIGKVNGREVDLNRNFPTAGWQSESKIFVAGEYSSVSAGEFPASEKEVSGLLKFIAKNGIKTVYTFHNCWSTVFSLTPSSRLERYSQLSGYRMFGIDEWNKLDPQHVAGNMNTWGVENGINVIEVELKHRWGSDWKQNKSALIDSITK